jgi:hypothetical protein
MTDRQKLTVHVTLGNGDDDRIRELSFRIPDNITQKDLLDYGFAIDGNSATVAARQYVDGDGELVPLAEALRDEQVRVLEWLGERGYEVNFR